MLYGTRLSAEMHRKLKSMHHSVAYPQFDDPIFVNLVEPPFLSHVPLIKNSP
jgi:hypothetical protein